jgi:hypothetical protein
MHMSGIHIPPLSQPNSEAREEALKIWEERLIRRALQESIQSVQVMLRSFLPDDASEFTADEHQMYAKWTGRIEAYQEMLTKLGGPIRGEKTSFEDITGYAQSVN